MHLATYKKPGLFIWSISDGAVVESKLKPEPKLVPRSQQPAPQIEMSEIESDSLAQSQGTATSEPPRSATALDYETIDLDSSATGSDGTTDANPAEISLFDGKELGKWQITQYGGEGDVFITEEGDLEFGFGAILTGVHWSEETPRKTNYEISLEAMKLDGTDFFCALTFPVGENHASFLIGGWGGGVVGISSVDDLDASENETMQIEGFKDDVWHKVRVKVTDDKIEAWIDDKKMVDLVTTDRKISLRPGDIELSVPLGICSFQTRAKYRNIVWKNLP